MCGMICRHIERFKGVVVPIDFRVTYAGKTYPLKNSGNFCDCLSHNVEVSFGRAHARHGSVEPLSIGMLCWFLLSNTRKRFFYRLFHLGNDRTDFLAVFFGDTAYLSRESGNIALGAKKENA